MFKHIEFIAHFKEITLGAKLTSIMLLALFTVILCIVMTMLQRNAHCSSVSEVVRVSLNCSLLNFLAAT